MVTPVKPSRPVLRRVNVADPVVSHAIRELQVAVEKVHHGDGEHYLGPVALTSGQTNKLKHGLGRAMSGWGVVRVIADLAVIGHYSISEVPGGDPLEDLWLSVKADGPGSIKATLRVF